MGAVRDRKTVVHVDIAERGQFACERRVVFLLAGMEPGVLQEQNLTGLEPVDCGLGGLADAVVREGNLSADCIGDLAGKRCQRFFRVAAFRPAKMGDEDHLAALAGDLVDGRRHAGDARPVGDLAVLHRGIEVDAQKDALAVDVDVVERAERAHDLLGPGPLSFVALSCRSSPALNSGRGKVRPIRKKPPSPGL